MDGRITLLIIGLVVLILMINSLLVERKITARSIALFGAIIIYCIFRIITFNNVGLFIGILNNAFMIICILLLVLKPKWGRKVIFNLKNRKATKEKR